MTTIKNARTLIYFILFIFFLFVYSEKKRNFAE